MQLLQCRPILNAIGHKNKLNINKSIQIKLRYKPVCCKFNGFNKIKDFTSKNFVALVLVGGTAFGMLQPAPGQFAQRYGASKWTTAGIFLLSGISLQDGDLKEACQAWPFGLLGLVSILVLTPMAASLILRAHLVPKELITGLALFCCAPTTLSSAVTLTQIVGANKALALALTVATNCLAILTMPFFISVFIARGLGVTVPANKLLWSLFRTLLLPLVVGKVLRENFNGLASFADRNRQTVALLSAILLSSVPWMQISCSRNMLLQVNVKSLIASLSLGIGLHFLFLGLNTLLVELVEQMTDSKDTSSARAVVLVASQKTLPVCVAVVDKLGGQLGEAGLLVVPIVLAHLTQIILDTVLVSFWLRGDKKKSFILERKMA